MVAALPHALGYLLPPILVASAAAGGWWVFPPVVVVFVVVPVVDLLSGLQRVSAHLDAAALEGNIWFRLVTWGWVPIQLALLAWMLRVVSRADLSVIEIVGVAIGVGLCAGGIGITFAHELVHRTEPGERALGEILLSTVSYPHFAIEHVHGHHRYVCTPQDPATARYGESLYQFLPRTISGSLASAVVLESERVRRRHGRAWHRSNRLIRYAAVQFALYTTVATLAGWLAVVIWAAQALVAILQVETINYIEHYGLTRRETSPTSYERIQPWHSWDAHHRVSNWLLINLARHSDHHCLASRRYPALAAEETTPQLPAGYGAMLLLAMVPPFWRRVMDPRVRAWRTRHGSIAARAGSY